MNIELEILRVLIDNEEKIIKRDGWDCNKIYKHIENYTKEQVKIAILNLKDEKLITNTTIRIDNYTNDIYRINEKGKDFYAKEKQKMTRLNKLEQMVNDDLNKLENIDSMDYNRKRDYYIELTSKYHSLINGFGNSLHGYSKDKEFYFDNIDVERINTNFKRIKTMLNVFKINGYKNNEEKNINQTIYNNTMNSTNTNNNTNTNNINLSFDTVRENIKKMDNLSDCELNEILLKIDEIEKIIKSSDTKRNKWNKLKSFLIWVADKGVDVGISLLPLILQLN